MNIYAFSTLFNGNEMVRDLIESGVPIAGVIGLADCAKNSEISGYESAQGLCNAYDIEFIPIKSYALRDPCDIYTLSGLNIDIALVLGWQRLIPKWAIQKFRIGGVGIHGSAYGINEGRGRSPQNWALLLGKAEFHLSIFKLEEGVDSGPVLVTTTVPLTEFDDIKTTHWKVGRAAVGMLVNCLSPTMFSKSKLTVQDHAARYFPKRIPEDGEVDWNRDAVEIYNFIRAQSRPYPGAFTKLEDDVLRIWRARPFEEHHAIGATHAPGEIIKIFENGDLLIATAKSKLLIEEYELSNASSKLLVGEKLNSANFYNQMRRIAARHKEAYPNFALAKDLNEYS